MIGNIWLNKQDTNTALHYFTEALQYAQTLATLHNPNDGAKLQCAMLDYISRVYEAQHNLPLALQHSTKAHITALQYQYRGGFSTQDIHYLEHRVHTLKSSSNE
jgi:hypothetical protein